MNDMYTSNAHFSFAMDITKSFAITEGSGDDTVVTDMLIRGVASSTREDLQGDQFSREGLEALREAIETGIDSGNGTFVRVPLISGHKPEWEDVLGEIIKAEIDDEDNLWITARLDEDSSKAQELYRKLSKKKVKLGLSVRGTITKYKMVWDEAKQRMKPVFNNCLIKEVSVTQQPVNPSPYPLAIAKSLYADPSYQEALLAMTKEAEMVDISKSEKDSYVHPVLAADHTETVNVEGDEAREQNEIAASEAHVPLTDVETPEEVVENSTVDSPEAPSEPQRVSDVPAEDSDANDVPEGYAPFPTTESPAQDAATQEVTTDPDDAATPVDKLASTIQAILEQIKSVQEELAALKSENEPIETQKAMADPAALEVNLDERIATAVAQAIEATGLTTLVKEVEVMKSSVESLSSQPADRSISVSKAKDEDDVNDPMSRYNSLKEQGADPFTAAFTAAYSKKK